MEIRDILYMLSTFLNYYRLEYAPIVVYDITQRRSYEKAKELVHLLSPSNNSWAYSSPVFGALVGNKADLEDRREVSFEVSNVAMFM